MNTIKLIVLLFYISACTSQTENSITLEGKWKITDWTYSSFVGRSLDTDEVENMNTSFNDLIIEFNTDNTFASNNPKFFEHLEKKTYHVNEYQEIIIDNQPYILLLRGENCYFFFNNIVLQLEKIKTYKGAKIKFEEIPIDNSKIAKIKDKKLSPTETIYPIENVSIPPKLKMAEFDDNCRIDCLYRSFQSAIKYHLDYVQAHKDTSYFIDFIIDTKGDIRNIEIKAVSNTKKRQRTISTETSTTENTILKQNIVRSLSVFHDILLPGKKDGKNVNTQIKLEVRLISS